jgi:hypothetical protein
MGTKKALLKGSLIGKGMAKHCKNMIFNPCANPHHNQITFPHLSSLFGFTVFESHWEQRVTTSEWLFLLYFFLSHCNKAHAVSFFVSLFSTYLLSALLHETQLETRPPKPTL